MKSVPNPTRRGVIKTGLATVAATCATPQAFANTPPQLMRHASREIVLQFDVAPGLAQGVPSSDLNRSG